MKNSILALGFLVLIAGSMYASESKRKLESSSSQDTKRLRQDTQQLQLNQRSLTYCAAITIQPFLDLLHSGADVNAMTEAGESALHLVAKSGDARLARLLLEKGAKCNLQDISGVTPLLIAAHNGHVEEVRELLQRQGIEINLATKDGCTPC